MTPLQSFSLAAKIIPFVCNFSGITKAQLESRIKTRRLVWTRWLAVHLFTIHTQLEKTEIATLLNWTNAGSVCHALRSLKDAVETDPLARVEITKLEEDFAATLQDLRL